MSLILFQTAPLISAEDTRQYLVWDKEGSEETVDHVCSELFKAAEGGEDPLTTQGRRGRSKKRKNKKERKRKTSSSSPSSSSSSSSSSQEKPDSSSSSEATGDPLLIQPWENLD